MTHAPDEALVNGGLADLERAARCFGARALGAPFFVRIYIQYSRGLCSLRATLVSSQLTFLFLGVLDFFCQKWFINPFPAAC